MFSQLHKDLTRPPGRTPRAKFWAGFAVICLSVWLQGFIMQRVGGHWSGFLLGFFWLILNVFMIYSLYARRLHDMSLSVGLWFAAIFLTLFTIAFTVAIGGGADYFAAMNADPSIAEDAERNRILIEKYQADMAANAPHAKWINMIPAALLTLFCGLMPGKPEANKYGPPPA